MFLTFLLPLDPALSLLWRDQAALGPLIQVMPLDLWTISTSGKHTYVVSANWITDSTSSVL